jgi:hypothetical protein
MGFVAVHVGYTPEQLSGWSSFSGLTTKYGNLFPRWICDEYGDPTELCHEIFHENDFMDGENCEIYLKKTFAEHGVDLCFDGRPSMDDDRWIDESE